MNLSPRLKIQSKALLLYTLFLSLSLTLKFKQNHQKIYPQSNDASIYNTFNLNGQNPTKNSKTKLISSQKIHFTADSMQLNYTQQVIRLSPLLKPAADINDRILYVQNSNLNHEKQVRILSNFTFVFFNSDELECKNLSSKLTQSLLSRTSEMRNFLENCLQINKVNFLTNQSERKIAQIAIRNQVIYLKGIEKMFESGCSKKVLLGQTYLLSNPNAKNWILGDWSYNQFIKSYIATVNNRTSINKCPLQKPFYDPITNTCINCQYPKNLWNMKLGKCVACPYAQVINLQTRTCASEIKYLNNIIDQKHPWITTEKNLKNIYDLFDKQKKQNGSIICPFNNPFILNQVCSNCPENHVYLLEQRRCMIIPFNMEYDRNMHKVVRKIFNYQINEAISSNVEPQLIGCPSQYPYYDNITCIECNFPNFFNVRTRNCQPCLNLDDCRQNKLNYITNSLGSNLTAASTKEVKNYFLKNGQKIKVNYIQQCPFATPYYNPAIRRCIQCPSQAYLFNISSLKCVSCPQRTWFNQTSYFCQLLKAVKTNTQAKNLIVEDLNKYKQQQNKITGVQCPQITPYFNGTQCQDCMNRKLFNTSSKSCVDCPQNTTYDITLMKCKDIGYANQQVNLYIPGKIDNLLGVPSYSVENYLEQFKNLNQTLFKLVKCPDQENSKKSGCVVCTGNYTFFNVKNFQCVQCKQLNKEKNICYDNMTYLTNTSFKDSFLGVIEGDVSRYIKEQQVKIKQNPDSYLVCPVNKPFSKQGVCQKCQKYFNIISFECIQCEHFDEDKKVCTVKLLVSNLKYGVPPYYTKNSTKLIQQYQLAIKNKTPICPYMTPFFNGQQCIVCQKSDGYFNLDAKKCENCSQGYRLNEIINECQEDPPKYYTSLSSEKLIFDRQPISYYEYKIEQAKKAGSTPCPKDKPYYTIKNECELCGSSQEYFNLLIRRCASCPSNTEYSQADHDCESPIGDVITPQATLEKSLANLFT